MHKRQLEFCIYVISTYTDVHIFFASSQCTSWIGELVASVVHTSSQEKNNYYNKETSDIWYPKFPYLGNRTCTKLIGKVSPQTWLYLGVIQWARALDAQNGMEEKTTNVTKKHLIFAIKIFLIWAIELALSWSAKSPQTGLYLGVIQWVRALDAQNGLYITASV